MKLVKSMPMPLSPALSVLEIFSTVNTLVESWDRRKNIDQFVDHTITLLSALSNPKLMEVGLEMLRSPNEKISLLGAELISRSNQELSAEITKALDTVRRMACSK